MGWSWGIGGNGLWGAVCQVDGSLARAVGRCLPLGLGRCALRGGGAGGSCRRAGGIGQVHKRWAIWGQHHGAVRSTSRRCRWAVGWAGWWCWGVRVHCRLGLWCGWCGICAAWGVRVASVQWCRTDPARGDKATRGLGDGGQRPAHLPKGHSGKGKGIRWTRKKKERANGGLCWGWGGGTWNSQGAESLAMSSGARASSAASRHLTISLSSNPCRFSSEYSYGVVSRLP